MAGTQQAVDSGGIAADCICEWAELLVLEHWDSLGLKVALESPRRWSLCPEVKLRGT